MDALLIVAAGACALAWLAEFGSRRMPRTDAFLDRLLTRKVRR